MVGLEDILKLMHKYRVSKLKHEGVEIEIAAHDELMLPGGVTLDPDQAEELKIRMEKAQREFLEDQANKDLYGSS